MSIKPYFVNGKARYVVKLSPSFSAEAGNLAAILTLLFTYGGE
jgi:hypothetical protein